MALPATGDLRRAVNLALATVPKAARLGREGFASGLGRLLAGRRVVVLDAAVLRRLDRVDTVVLDAEVLVTGELMLGEVIPLAVEGILISSLPALRLRRMARGGRPADVS